MAKTRGKNRNTSDTSSVSVISISGTVSTKIKDSGGVFCFFSVSNIGNKAVKIKLQAASVDNLYVGTVIVPKDGGYWEMLVDNLYTGEISAIADGVAGTRD